MLISGIRKVQSLKIKLGSTEIKSSEAIKYIGIMVDRRLKYREYACTKAARVSNALARMMPNIGCPHANLKSIKCSPTKGSANLGIYSK